MLHSLPSIIVLDSEPKVAEDKLRMKRLLVTAGDERAKVQPSWRYVQNARHLIGQLSVGLDTAEHEPSEVSQRLQNLKGA